MGNMKKLMMFAALGALSVPTFSNRYDAFKPVFDQMDKQIATASNDRIKIWAYCKNTGDFADYNSCNNALNRLSAKPGLFGRKQSPVSQAEEAARAILLLACTSRSLVAGVDVDYNGKGVSGNNITGGGLGMYGGPRELSPKYKALVDPTNAQVVITSGVFIRKGEESRQTPHDGYSLDILMGKQRGQFGVDFHHVPEKFARMLYSGAALNPTVCYLNDKKTNFVDFTSDAATL